MLESMDTVLATDVPALMAQFPSERYDDAAAYSEQAGAGAGADGSLMGAATGGAGAGSANPFAAFGGGSGVDMAQWLITPSQQAKYSCRI